MAGFVKDTGVLTRLPVDLTLGLALITWVLVAVWLYSSVPRRVHGVLLALLLLVPPVFYAAWTDYGTNKVGRLLVFTCLAIMAPVVLIRDASDVTRHLWALTGMAGVVVVTALVDPRPSSDYAGAPIMTASAGTIGLGSAAGHVLVVIAVGLVWKRLPLLALVAAGGAVYVLLQSGSRGPLISALLAVLVGTVLTRVRPRFGRAAVFGGLLALGVMVAYSLAPRFSQRRILALLEGDTTGSVDGRISLFHIAYESILRHPLGIGWGNFEGIAFLGYTYPHNLILEVLAEAGLIFGGLFLSWMFVKIVQTRRITIDFVGAAVFASVIFWLSETMVSGDLNDNRVFFYILGLAIAARAVATPDAQLPGTVDRTRPGSGTASRGLSGPRLRIPAELATRPTR